MAAGTQATTLSVADRLRSWISRYNIVFEGPLPSQDWPHRYSSIFRSVRDIDRIRFDDYKATDDRGLLTVSEMKARVVNINKIAYICRGARSNESTWRLKMEHWILWRFDAEVACHKCRKRLWISEFQTLPHDPDHAEELRSRRTQRVLCNCSEPERAMVDRWERGQTRVFADRADDLVLHQDSMELLGCGVKERKPDRIFGLENTAMFDRYVSSKENESLRHSPFADGKIFYPFLIIEAKSEKGSPGFESIETQTAFPIRSLLQLQDKLAMHTGININPLLWFLANQGDEWRVYAAVVDNSQFRIFDLWHGTILSRDCALQLLLIIDNICEWARDVYRLDVLRCLSGGQLDLRAITPAWSTTQSQNDSRADSDEPSSSSTGTVTPQIESPPQLATLADPALDALIPELDVAMIDAEGFDDSLLPTRPTDADSNHPLLKYDSQNPSSPVWTKLATIQHSDLVQFKFRYCTIPEDLEPLRQLLRTINESGDLGIRARETLSLFECHAAIRTNMAAVIDLAELWVGDANWPTVPEIPPTKSVLALVDFHTYFDIGSWQTIRLLDCIVCSQTAWNLLLQVSGYSNPPARNPWTSNQRADLCTYVHALRFFHGKDSTTAALLNLKLQLCGPKSHNPPSTDLTWEKPADSRGANPSFHKHVLMQGDTHSQHIHNTTKQREIPSTAPRTSWLDSILPVQSIKAKYGAILLRKPPSWESCPYFCLAVFDPGVDFADERSLGRMLDRVVTAKDVYVVTDGERKSNPFDDDADRQAVQMWSKILAGRAAADTQWPMLQ